MVTKQVKLTQAEACDYRVAATFRLREKGGSYRIKIKGFTLIEMLAVIAIIGILAGLLIPAASKARRDAAIQKAKTTISALETALSMYYTDYGMYPPSASSSTQANGNSFTPVNETNLVGALSSSTKGGPYMKFRNEDLRKDPVSSRMVLVDPWGMAYVYISRRYITLGNPATVGDISNTEGPMWPNTTGPPSTDRLKNTYNIYSFGPDVKTNGNLSGNATGAYSPLYWNEPEDGNNIKSSTYPGDAYNDDDINNW